MKKIILLVTLLVLLLTPFAFAGPDVPDTVKDVLLDEIADNANRLDIVSDATTPTDLTGTLGNVALTVGDGNGDYTIADGGISGRKLTLALQEITTTGAGTVNHWVLSDGTTIYAVGTVTAKVVDSAAVYESAEVVIVEVRDAQ